MRFTQRAARTLAAPAWGLCLLVGCASADGSDHSSPPSPRPLVEREGVPLAPGTYQIGYHLDADEVVPHAFITVPSGYVESSTWYVVSDDGHEYVGLWTARDADRDACHHGEADVYDPGPSVDDLARALVRTRSVRASGPEPVTLAGYHGLYVELASPRHMSRCRDPKAGLWTSGTGGRGIYSAGQVDRVWILDADGQRILVNAAYSARSSASDIDKLDAMVDSLDFTTPGE